MPLISGEGGGGGAFNGGTVTGTVNLAPTTDITPLFMSVPNGAFSRVFEADCAPNKPGSMYYDADGALAVLFPNAEPALVLTGAQDGISDVLRVQQTSGARALTVPAGGGIQAVPITSGALPTVAPASGVAFQCSTTRDVDLCVPFTGDATNNAATLKIELSPDNVTFSVLDTLSIAAALNLTGAINTPVSVAVPAAWYVKLTATHGTIGTSTYY